MSQSYSGQSSWWSQLVPLRAAALALATVGLSGCTNWTPQYSNVTPLTGPAPYMNRTPMHSALVCLQTSTRAMPDVRLGVADFVDGSGASLGESDVNGRYFSQRPDLMLIVALSKTGVRLVNRTSTAVAEWEMRQAMERRLGEGKPVLVGQTRFDYRPVRAGEFLGSTYYVNGAITEINWSLSSNVEEAGFLGATAGRRTYRVSIAIDLVVTNSLTTEVVFARSYSKQLVGNETGAGVFRFVEASIMPKSRVELFQANIGQKQNEPVQAALRWLVELAGYETVASLTGGDAQCDMLVPGQDGDEGEDGNPGSFAPPLQVRGAAPDTQPGQAQPAAVRRPAATVGQPLPAPPPTPSAPLRPHQQPQSPISRTRAAPVPEYGRPPATYPLRGHRTAAARAGSWVNQEESGATNAAPDLAGMPAQIDRGRGEPSRPLPVATSLAPQATPPRAVVSTGPAAMRQGGKAPDTTPAGVAKSADPRTRGIEEEAVAAYSVVGPPVAGAQGAVEPERRDARAADTVSFLSQPTVAPAEPPAAQERAGAVVVPAYRVTSGMAPARGIRMPNARERAIEEEANAAGGVVAQVAPQGPGGSDSGSYQLPQPSPETRVNDRGEEPQPVQPYQPSGQHAVRSLFRTRLHSNGASSAQSDWAHANFAPTDGSGDE